MSSEKSLNAEIFEIMSYDSMTSYPKTMSLTGALKSTAMNIYHIT